VIVQIVPAETPATQYCPAGHETIVEGVEQKKPAGQGEGADERARQKKPDAHGICCDEAEGQ
jgi:hypothetical protein